MNKAEMATRLEIREELESKLEARYQEKLQVFIKENEALKASITGESSRSVTQMNTIQQLKTDNLALQREKEKLTGELQSLQHHHKKLRENYEKIKPEWCEFKRLNPRAIRKKLDEKRKEVKTKSGSLQLMQKTLAEKEQKLKSLQDTVIALRWELNRQQKLPEVSEATYIYSSACGYFKVYPSEFKSDVRPFLDAEHNYRVLDTRDGTSFVASKTEDSIRFITPELVPADVSDFIESLLAAATESEAASTVNGQLI